MLETLSSCSADEQVRALRELRSLTDADVLRLEAVLPDLLRDADPTVLRALAGALGGRRDHPAAVRVLEHLARRGPPVRAAALGALRAPAGTSAPAGARPSPVVPTVTGTFRGAAPATPAVEVPASGAPTARIAGSAAPSVAAAAPVPSPAIQPAQPAKPWDAAFEDVLREPTKERIAAAALALMEVGDPTSRPAEATRQALQALAGRLAMASFDHEGELQQGLARLARGLKAL